MASTKAKIGFIKGSSNNGSLVGGGTAINPTGTYDKIYFNTKLSVEEVHSLIDNVIPEGGRYDPFSISNVVHNGTNYTATIISIQKGLLSDLGLDDEGYMYMIMYTDPINESDIVLYCNVHNDLLEQYYGITKIGWQEFNNPVVLPITFIGSVSENTIEQNELLKNLISATPFESGGGITPSGTLDITENGTYDVTQYASANVSVEVDIDNISGLQALLDKQKHMKYLFYGFPDDNLNAYASLDTSQVIDMTRTFFGSAITEIPPFNFSNVEIFNGTFEQCGKLKTPPSIDFSNAIEVESMFLLSGISGELPQYNFSNVRKMSSFCANTKITKIPVLETSKVIDFMNAFGRCTELEEVLGLDLISSTNNSSMFSNAQKLKVLYVYNIKNSLMIGSNAGENNYNVSWGHLLTLDSLINTIKELINVGSAKTLTMGSTNLEKIANVYVKFTDSTQTSIASGTKGDVVVCESTDAGAMLLSDYTSLKNWTLA